MNSKNEKLIWFKKAKCAGTSLEAILHRHGSIYYVHPRTTLKELQDPLNRIICVREALFPYGKTRFKQGGNDYILRGSKLAFQLRRQLHHPFKPKLFMHRHFPEFLDSHHKFAVVRNPYDKFISSWKYLKSTRDLDIEIVLANLPKRRRLHDWVHLTQTQYECLADGDGGLMVDEIIYMEKYFHQSIREVLRRIGLPDEDLPVENRSRRQKYTKYLTPVIAEQIYKGFSVDFQAFGYSADPEQIEPEICEKPQTAAAPGGLTQRNAH